MSKTIYKDIFVKTYESLAHKFLDYERASEKLKDILKERKNILEIGIGTGLIAIPLAKHGFSIDTIDNSREMLDKLKEKLDKNNIKNIKYEHADFASYKNKRKYDAVISHSAVFFITKTQKEEYFETYLDNKLEIEEGLKKIYNSLNEDGLFIMNIQPEISTLDINSYYYKCELEKISTEKIRKTHKLYENGKNVYEETVLKTILPFTEFIEIAKRTGFKTVIKEDNYWLILQK